MERNLDKVFDRIIRGESRRFTKISYGERVEEFPSYFKDMKEMYQKEWHSIYNPNNIFIPYILVSMELILRGIIDVDASLTKNRPTASQLLERLTGKDSPLTNTEDKILFNIGKKIDEKRFQVLGQAPNERLAQEVAQQLIKDDIIDESLLVVERWNKNVYIKNLYQVLSDIKDKYYTKVERLNNSYRNAVLHANRPLLLEGDDLFEEILIDYSRLINSVWGDPIMPYEKERDLSKDPRAKWYL